MYLLHFIFCALVVHKSATFLNLQTDKKQQNNNQPVRIRREFHFCFFDNEREKWLLNNLYSEQLLNPNHTDGSDLPLKIPIAQLSRWRCIYVYRCMQIIMNYFRGISDGSKDIFNILESSRSKDFTNDSSAIQGSPKAVLLALFALKLAHRSGRISDEEKFQFKNSLLSNDIVREDVLGKVSVLLQLLFQLKW